MAKQVTGRVVDYSDSSPLAGVMVAAVQPPFGLPYNAVTDASGNFSIDLPFDTVGWTVTFTLPGYTSTTVDISTLFSGTGVALVPVGFVIPSYGGGGSTGSGSSGSGSGSGSGPGPVSTPTSPVANNLSSYSPTENVLWIGGMFLLYWLFFGKKHKR